MLNVNLDDATEKYLVEIVAQVKTSSSELIKRLLRELWNKLQPQKTVLERMGGYPQHLLDGPSNLSDRDARYKYLAEYFQKRYEQRQQKQEA